MLSNNAYVNACAYTAYTVVLLFLVLAVNSNWFQIYTFLLKPPILMYSCMLTYCERLETVIARGTHACFDLSQRLDSEAEPLTSSGSSQGYGSISPGNNGLPWCHYDVMLAQLSSSSSSTICTSSDTTQNTLTELTLEPTHYFTVPWKFCRSAFEHCFCIFCELVCLCILSQNAWKLDRPYVP